MPVKVSSTECLILVRAQGAVDVDDVAQLTQAVETFVVRRAAFLVVIDATEAESVSAAARRHLGEHRRDHLKRGPDLELGLVLATSSAIIRGVATAISWISGSLDTLRVVDDRRELTRVTKEMLHHCQRTLSSTESDALMAFSRR